MNERIKELATKAGIPIKLYPDVELFEPLFKLIIDECCEIATTSGKPVIAKRIRDHLCK